jgi:hypothetical protein
MLETLSSNIPLTPIALGVRIFHLTGGGHPYFSTKEMANNTQS